MRCQQPTLSVRQFQEADPPANVQSHWKGARYTYIEKISASASGPQNTGTSMFIWKEKLTENISLGRIITIKLSGWESLNNTNLPQGSTD